MLCADMQNDMLKYVQCVEENHRNYKEKVGRRNFGCVNTLKSSGHYTYHHA